MHKFRHQFQFFDAANQISQIQKSIFYKEEVASENKKFKMKELKIFYISMTWGSSMEAFIRTGPLGAPRPIHQEDA